jgi:hemin uptake protein HemP
MIQQEAPTLGTASPQRAGNHGEARQLDSRALFGSERELLIHHNGELYRLRLTRAGKLILTK